MPPKAIQFALFLAASLLVLPAQETFTGIPSSGRPSVISGITVPPIPGAPFSATVVVEDERYDYFGPDEVWRTINLIARDSRGRTHNESRRLMPESFHGSPPLLGFRLYDPQTRIRTICDPVLRLARHQAFSEESATESTPDPAVRIQDLGTTVLDGLQAKGTRRTLSLSAKATRTGSPADIEDEVWYSDDLHLDLLVRHSDSRVGTQTIGVSDLKREEPPASMFEVPPGYKIVDATPTAAPAQQPVPGPPSRKQPAAKPIP
jgi:hypothetical protein